MRIRPFRASDLAQVLSVWNKSLPFDPVTEGYFCRQVLLDPNFQAANMLVAAPNGQIIGFVLGIARQVPFFAAGLEPDQAWITAFGVDPRYHRQGVGQQLFETLLTRFEAQGRRRVSIAPYVPNYMVPGIDQHAYPAAAAFLKNSFHFSGTEEAASMGINLTGYQIPPDIADLGRRLETEDGLSIQTVAAEDLPELMSFIVEQFGWDWYRHTREYLLSFFGRVDQEHISVLVAKLQDRIVGFCQQRGERFGPFGVHPDCRGRGIGRLLLVRCLLEMRRQGIYYSYFLWAPADAARLYARVGFEQRRQFTIFEKALS